MTVPRPRTKKPALEQRIAAWARAYQAVSEEMKLRADQEYMASGSKTVHDAVVVGAGMVAAQLIQGIGYEED